MVCMRTDGLAGVLIAASPERAAAAGRTLAAGRCVTISRCAGAATCCLAGCTTCCVATGAGAGCAAPSRFGAPPRVVSHWLSSHKIRSFAEMCGVGWWHFGQND